MLRDIGLVFFVYRALVCLFFIALSFDKSASQKSLLIIPSAVYISFSMYVFLFPGRFQVFKNYGDMFFIPLMALLSGQRESLFALLPPVAMYTSRNLFKGMLFLWLSVALAFYYYGNLGLAFLPVFLALFFSSLHPDLVEALRKERIYVRKLRKAHSGLLQDYAKIEKDLYNATQTARLIEVLQKSQSLQEYLGTLKEVFQLKAVSVTPAREGISGELVVNRAPDGLSVPVKLSKGLVYMNFYFHSPIEIYDKEKIGNLEKAAKLINLYITDYEEQSQARVVAS